MLDHQPVDGTGHPFPARTPEREARWRRDRELFDRFRRTGDPAAHDAIVVRFLPLVRRLASRYGHTSEPFDDLVQVGSLGLLMAIDRFDPDRGIAFSSFAVPTISGEIKRHFRDRTWSVRVPRGTQEAIQRMGAAEQGLEATLGRPPTVAEIASELGLGVEEVLDARMASLARTTDSLDRPLDAEEGQAAMSLYPVEDDGFAAAEDAATLASLLSHLDAREREALRLRYQEDLKQSDIGERLGCSQMHVSRLLRGAIARLSAVHEAQERTAA